MCPDVPAEPAAPIPETKTEETGTGQPEPTSSIRSRVVARGPTNNGVGPLIDCTLSPRAERGTRIAAVILGFGLTAAGVTPALADTVGIASFYGGRHHGGPTASGERFNQNAMTAAHRSYPMGTQVRVTNLRNGKAVVLRINDRGPFVRGRIIDVSRGAASQLGFIGNGLTRVRVERVGDTKVAQN